MALTVSVWKRSGRREPFTTAKLTAHLQRLCYAPLRSELDAGAHSDRQRAAECALVSAAAADVPRLVELVRAQVAAEVDSESISWTAAAVAHAQGHDLLAARLVCVTVDRTAPKRFSVAMGALLDAGSVPAGEQALVRWLVDTHAVTLDGAVRRGRDAYPYAVLLHEHVPHLLRVGSRVAERVQHRLLRHALRTVPVGDDAELDRAVARYVVSSGAADEEAEEEEFDGGAH